MQITLKQRVDDGQRVWYAGSVVETSKYPRLEARLRELGLMKKTAPAPKDPREFDMKLARAPADKMVRGYEAK